MTCVTTAATKKAKMAASGFQVTNPTTVAAVSQTSG